MNGVLAIARREVAERRAILITAAVLAVLQFGVLLLPGLQQFGTSMVVAATGGFVATIYLVALALLLGASFIGRDLADKRLSFYFAKPISASSIWFGKLAGSAFTIAAVAAVILIPTILVADLPGETVLRAVGLLALGVTTLFLLAHAVGTMFRSRSPLILADAACASIAGAGVYVAFRMLALGYAGLLRFVLAWTLIALFLALLVAAGAWQLSRGRTDLLRNHRELSRFLWSAAGATLLLLGGAVLWIVSVTPDDLRRDVWAAQPPAGKWVMLAGRMKDRVDYTAGFFVNLENGAYQRVDAHSIWWQTFFTRDGRLGGQLRPIGKWGKAPVQLDLVRFGEKDVSVTPTNVTFANYAEPMINDRGTRVAALASNLVTVQSLPDGKTLAAVRLPHPPQRVRLYFVGDDRVRVYAHGDHALDIYELDIPSRRLEHTGELSRGDIAFFNANADGSRLLLSVRDGLLVADGRTAAVVGTIAGEGRGVILSDGRVAVVNGKLAKLSIYGADYALQRELALPGLRMIPYLREVAGSKLIVGGNRAAIASEPNGRGWRVYVVDLGRGEIVRTGYDLRPMEHDFHLGVWQRDPRRVPANPDTPFVFRDRRGGVVLWDAGSGSRRAVTRISSLPAALLTAVLQRIGPGLRLG